MRIVIDMNLGVDWADVLGRGGHQAVHWSVIGNHDDDDAAIMTWAAENDHAVMTADLDFGTLLAATKAPWPSVVQLRSARTLAPQSSVVVLEALRRTALEIEAGALLTIHADRFRIRPLPV